MVRREPPHDARVQRLLDMARAEPDATRVEWLLDQAERLTIRADEQAAGQTPPPR